MSDNTTTDTTNPQRWQSDDDHRAAADKIAEAIGQDAYDAVCNLHHLRVTTGPWDPATGTAPGVTVDVEYLGDGPRVAEGEPVSDDLAALYERAHEVFEGPGSEGVWPLVLVDDQGRRFEIEMEVSVKALPDVAGDLARYDAQLAEVRASQERARVHLGTHDRRTPHAAQASQR